MPSDTTSFPFTPLEATLSYPVSPALKADLDALPTIDLDALRIRWRKLFRSPPPPQLTRSIMVRIIAYAFRPTLLATSIGKRLGS